MSYTGPQALPSPARRHVLVRHGDKVGRTPASELLFSTGKLRDILGLISIDGFLIHDAPMYRCLCPLIPRPSDLVQGVAMSTTASMLIRFFAQMPLFFVTPRAFVSCKYRNRHHVTYLCFIPYLLIALKLWL